MEEPKTPTFCASVQGLPGTSVCQMFVCLCFGPTFDVFSVCMLVNSNRAGLIISSTVPVFFICFQNVHFGLTAKLLFVPPSSKDMVYSCLSLSALCRPAPS